MSDMWQTRNNRNEPRAFPVPAGRERAAFGRLVGTGLWFSPRADCLLFLALSGAVGGCFYLEDGVVCTAVFVYGVSVTVADVSGEPVAGATLTLTEDEYSEMMEQIDPLRPGVYVGAGERAGMYTLTVEADGFEPATIENVSVDEDECHVIPVSRDVTLTAG